MASINTQVFVDDAGEIRTVRVDGQARGIGIGSAATIFLRLIGRDFEDDLTKVISMADQIIESANAVRSDALRTLAALKPGEEIVAVISDAVAEDG